MAPSRSTGSNGFPSVHAAGSTGCRHSAHKKITVRFASGAISLPKTTGPRPADRKQMRLYPRASSISTRRAAFFWMFGVSLAMFGIDRNSLSSRIDAVLIVHPVTRDFCADLRRRQEVLTSARTPDTVKKAINRVTNMFLKVLSSNTSGALLPQSSTLAPRGRQRFYPTRRSLLVSPVSSAVGRFRGATWSCR